MPPGLRVDWFRVFDDLGKEGFTIYDIAEQTSIPRSTMRHWKDQDTEPRHSDGEKVLTFWESATGRTRKDAPMRAADPSAASQRR